MKTETEIRNAIELYGDMIRKICFIHLKQEADVEDIFQDVFIKYMMHNRDFDNKEHEKAWLLRVSINACKDKLKSWFHKNVELYEDMQLHPFHKQEDYHILEMVLKLPDKYKDVIYLYYYEGYSTKEISTILGKKENTIFTWLKRAKEALRKELGGDYFA